MTVKRIVSNIAANNAHDATGFYRDLLGLEIVMDLGWIVTFANTEQTVPQISIATEGGSGTAVPDLSIEVDNVEEIYHKAVDAGYPIEYELTNEPWGIRRFYVKDPLGKVVNIVEHIAT